MAQRVFIVTGGNKGIGFETAKKLCRDLKGENAVVVITSRDKENGVQALAKLAAEGLKAEMELLDITKKESRESFVAAIKSKYGHVDSLVNNAGFAFKKAATEPVAVQAKVTCGINYYATRDITLDMMGLFKPGSRIVNVASAAGEMALQEMSAELRHRLMSKSARQEDIDKVVDDFIVACEKGQQEGWPSSTYGLSKAAVIALTAAWARKADHCPSMEACRDMVITCCCPGWCKTDLAGWEAPPLTAADGANVVAPLALSSTKQQHHGKF
ncbi:carbonyl reductase, putative, partial [Eimeria tenella]